MATHLEKEYLEKIFQQDYEDLAGRTLRFTRVRIPGREVCLAHIITPTDESVYQNLGLHIGVHEGEDHRGESVGLMRFTPWEAVVAAADAALKAGNVEIGFMDRFCGTLIVTGRLADVTSAMESVVGFFRDELGFPVCEIHRS